MIKAELINHMGSDLTVVNAARVSFDKESELEFKCDTCNDNKDDCWLHDDVCGVDSPTIGKYVLSNGDARLISYLARHDHFTPFTHAIITMRETVPTFLARQRYKHMVGFTYNEVSRRYVDDTPEFYVPDEWRERPSKDKKQGSGGVSEYSDAANEIYTSFCARALDTYQSFIEDGLAPEQARMILPQSMMTSYYVTGSLSAWARAYKLRISPDSQKEIQDLAKQWDNIIQPLYPESWKALTHP